MQAGGALSPEEEKNLSFWILRRKRIQENKKARDKQALFLVSKLGWVERSKQRTTALSTEQEVQLCNEGWAHFDRLLWQTGCAPYSYMKDYVSQPERFRLNSEETVISMSDQVPVWLKPDSGKRLMPRKMLQAAQKQRSQRKRRALAQAEGQSAEADEQIRSLVCAAVNPASSMSRYTLVARQLIHDYYKVGAVPRGTPCHH